MTITFDAPALSGGLTSGQGAGRDLVDDCSGGIDWSAGLAGLSRYQGRAQQNPAGGLLTRVIEGEIIPRLLLAHRNLQRPAANIERPKADIDSAAFARLVLASEPAEIVDHVERLMDRGVKLERIFLDLLAPVARKLGEFWEEDICTFTEVTLGLSRLHQVLHEIGRRAGGDMLNRNAKRRVYLVPAPGEQHTFGLSMLEEFFLHAGWETASDHAASRATILQTAATQSLDIIGFSIGCNEFLGPLSELIDKTRAASRNRNLAIMVGGGLIPGHPEIAAKLGSATVVADGVHAVQTAENLVSGDSNPKEPKRVV